MNMTSIRINTKLCIYHTDTSGWIWIFFLNVPTTLFDLHKIIVLLSYPAINTLKPIERIRPLLTELCYEECLATFPIVLKNITKELQGNTMENQKKGHEKIVQILK